MGPSPRVRGSRSQRSGRAPRRGSIPACAGKPRRADGCARRRGVHPRVCGEASPPASRAHSGSGPSPRVRGSRRVQAGVAPGAGSIPACAGKPPPSSAAADRAAVHPRVCGEARVARSSGGHVTGPSPRVRGSHGEPRADRRRDGSIPACAGKPRGPSRCPRCGWVHPRVCGEAGHIVRSDRAASGPSPRVRGSPVAHRREQDGVGSIPACAGKPGPPRRRAGSLRVHPRVCGEARVARSSGGHLTGPSPRVRGSPQHAEPAGEGEGSIPACAGKPRRLGRPRSARGVHPRVCGEAVSVHQRAAQGSGPSPRVRGSHAVARLGASRAGSIPACAGKPSHDMT